HRGEIRRASVGARRGLCARLRHRLARSRSLRAAKDGGIRRAGSEEARPRARSRTVTAIDRITPTRRPNRAVWGRQRWRKLLFMHWPVPVDIMRRAVPRAFDLDLHEGIAYVGVVAFAMEGVRPLFLPE